MIFERLRQRAELAAQESVERAKAKLADRLSGDGLTGDISERGVTVSGRGLVRRLFTDARLRWIGGLFR